MTSPPIENFRLGFKAYFDAPYLVPCEALEMTIALLRGAGLDPNRYTIDPGHGSRRDMRRSGCIYTGAEAIAEIGREDDASFFVQAIRGEAEQMIHISKPFPRSPFQGFVVTPTPGLKISHFRSLVSTTARKANLTLGGVNEGGYLEWQRCDDPDRYTRKYGSPESFNISELENVLASMNRRLDCSRNPGRIGSVNKMSVFVAADMWLGPTFWKFAPCTKEEVLKEPWVELEDTEHYLYLKAYPEPFTRPDGEQGRIQRRLWNVLFHQDCEWPPGSGGISDVAVGGPPELMPST